VEEQKKEEVKPIKVEGVKKWEVKKILNKRKIRGVSKSRKVNLVSFYFSFSFSFSFSFIFLFSIFRT